MRFGQASEQNARPPGSDLAVSVFHKVDGQVDGVRHEYFHFQARSSRVAATRRDSRAKTIGSTSSQSCEARHGCSRGALPSEKYNPPHRTRAMFTIRFNTGATMNCAHLPAIVSLGLCEYHSESEDPF